MEFRMSQHNTSDDAMAHTSMSAKNAQRDEIQKEIEAFLKQGGKIEVLECGKSAYVNTAAANDEDSSPDAVEDSLQADVEEIEE